MNPIIVVGMHRSGTSLITRILKAHNVFMGVNTGMHDESPFFLKLNSWILRQTGSYWDTPENIQLLDNESMLTQTFTIFLKNVLKSPLCLKFTGFLQFIPFVRKQKLSKAWGWKDPINSLTLDIWLTIYPNAKVIFIKRHGVDVAQSLHTRASVYEKRSRERYSTNRVYRIYSIYRQLIRPLDRSRAFNDSLRSKDIMCGLNLWSFYNDRIERSLKNIRTENILRVSYEDLLTNPEINLQSVTRFCNLQMKPESVESLKKGRAYHYRNNPELVQFEKNHRQVLATHGY